MNCTLGENLQKERWVMGRQKLRKIQQQLIPWREREFVRCLAVLVNIIFTLLQSQVLPLKHLFNCVHAEYSERRIVHLGRWIQGLLFGNSFLHVKMLTCSFVQGKIRTRKYWQLFHSYSSYFHFRQSDSSEVWRNSYCNSDRFAFSLHQCDLTWLAENNEVFSFGCGSDGRLGHPEVEGHRYLYKEFVPRRIEALMGQKVTEIATSYYHCIAHVDKWLSSIECICTWRQ